MRGTLTLILVPLAAFCCLAFLLCGDLGEGIGRYACRLFYGSIVIACIVALRAV
jgi:hypothetical protein